ncbi:uncharacterized protein [Ranitomeya imitator]|uniref:uncharacterized protein n=1 Tax=Ranitomeya imitator TaxID=111125 RepID=UPI0037E7ECB6
MKKLSSSYKKSLCKECTDKIISEERPSLIEEIKTLIQQEIKTSLATLSQPTPSPSAPPEAKKRKLNPQEEEQEDSQGETSDEPPEEGELSLDSETVQQERYYFSSSDIEELLTAVRKTMEVEEEKTAQSVQEEMFGGLRSRKRQVFPIHQNIRDLVLDEWESPEKKLTTPAEIKDRFPVDAETASCWSEVPKVDVQIARVAKKTTLPFEDASQLRDPLERKMDGLLRKSWETSASLLNINSVSTCVARSMHRWLGQLEEHLSSGTPREDILASLPIFQKATGFLADASAESVRVTARSSALSNSVRRALWLRSWSGDMTSKMRLCSIPFKGKYMFGPALDDLLEKASDKKKTLPEPRNPRKRPFRTQQEHTPQYRGKGKQVAGAIRKEGKTGIFFFHNPKTRESNDAVIVGGRISNFLPVWQEIGVDQWTLRLVKEGMKIEFTSYPQKRMKTTTLSTPKLQSTLITGIEDLLINKVISTVPKDERNKGHYSSLFLIRKPNGTHRMIINLKPLNQYVTYRRFRMESVRSTVPLIGQDFVMATIDLQDAYYHVPVHPTYRKFLRFAVTRGEVIDHFQFNVLPFGLSSAPRIFTKVMSEVMAYIRSRRICIIPYLDDLLVVAPTVPILQEHLQTTVQILSSLGWVINPKKSDMVPSTTKIFLGVLLDSHRQTSFLPEQKRSLLTSRIRTLRDKKRVSLRWAMSVLGTMTSCIQMVAWAQAHTRILQTHILSSWDGSPGSLDKKIRIPPHVKSSLTWWLQKENLMRGVPWLQVPAVTITVDASGKGWGATVDQHIFQGFWSAEITQQSSNYKELKAVEEVLKAAVTLVQNSHLKIYSDNMTTVAHLRHQGSTRHEDLKRISARIFSWAEEHVLSISALHIKGEINVQADFLSRTEVHPGEWSLNPEVFQILVKRWGQPEVDLFANSQNAKVDQFFSLDPMNPGLAVDALVQPWTFSLAYAFPPLPILPKVLQKIRAEKLKVILVAPLWPKRGWFGALISLKIDGPIALPPVKDLLYQGPILHPDPERLHLNAWLLNSQF